MFNDVLVFNAPITINDVLLFNTLIVVDVELVFNVFLVVIDFNDALDFEHTDQ